MFTVGARIRASQSTRRADPEYFTTTLAVGVGLQLLDTHRVPLSRQALVDAIGDTGMVHRSGEEHRAAVREVLFPGFGPDRYASVVGALLTLRKEKLSQQLVNVEDLSKVLSDALAPLDDHDIAAVAEGFERLDRRRAELGRLEAELREVRILAGRQRDYARAVVVSGAAGVTSAETRRDNVTRDERHARDDLHTARDEADRAQSDLATAEGRVGDIGIEIEACKDSDAYKEGVALTDLRTQARRLAEIADRQRASAERARTTSDRAAREREGALAVRVESAANLEQAARDLRSAAQPIGADAVVAEAGETQQVEEGERLVVAWTHSRRSLLADVRAALSAHETAVSRRHLYEEQAEEAGKVLADRAQAHRQALAAAAEAAGRYGAAVAQWASGCAILGPDRVAAALPQPQDDPDTVDLALAHLRRVVETELAIAGRDLDAEHEEVEQARLDLLAERTRWKHTALPEVEPPPWRTTREALAGAPLWSLVDPSADSPPEAVDCLEAALTAAGLLDAWVQPDGSVTLPEGRADLVLGSRPPAAGESLASMLTPAPGGEVAEATVIAVLASVPLVPTALPQADHPDPGGAEVAVGRDGTYRLGSAVGRGPDRPARVLGAPARERHRQARLAELDAALAGATERLAAIEHRRQDLSRRAAAVRSELDAVPSGMPVREAAREADAATVRLGEARDREEALRAQIRAAEEDVRTALRSLTSLSARHGLPAERAGLDAVDDGLRRLEFSLTTWTRRRRDAAAAALQLARAEERADDAEAMAGQAEADHAAAAGEATAVAQRVAALDANVGTEYRQLLQQIDTLDAERRETKRRIDDLRQRTPALQRRVGELERIVQDAADARQRAEEARETAHRHLIAAADDLLTDAGFQRASALDGVSAVLAFARSLLADHSEVRFDPEVIERLSERVREQVHQAQTALGARVDVDRELTDHRWVLRTTVGGVRRRAGELVDALAGELESGRAELAADEERLFEQTLAGSVRRALAARIRQANALVDTINLQLDAVRTATAGVGVRLQWAVDPDQRDAVKAARALLLRDSDDLTDAERASLQEFVRARVDQARAELEANAPWEARLRETLDYRAWHRFSVQIAHQDWDGYQPATPRRLQRLSTGERSMALHLPMIASVAAHYADEHGRPSVCPRLILLDELFAGVDAANRAQLFGTFTAWDLDAVFTSDHEWCQYATLDGIAIHHLHSGRPGEPVTSTRFTWDGHRRRIDPGSTAA